MEASFRSDRTLGIFVIFFSIILGVFSYIIDFNPNQLTLSARFFPLLLAGILFCLGLTLCLRPGPVPMRATLYKIWNFKGLVIGILVFLYFVSFRYVDFRLGAWLFMLVSMWFLGARRAWELAIIPILVSLSIYIVFRHGFTVLLPVWI